MKSSWRRTRQVAKRRPPSGQVLVLACLLVLVVALAVLATVNLGHHVVERVRLQNTADAAAYSMASMEARAFNFYAFSNRTQASHYVSAMVWQSYLSFIYFTEAFLTDVYGVMKTLDGCVGERSGFWHVACPVLESLPYVGPVMRALSTIIGVYRAVVYAYQQLLRDLDPDHVIGRIVIPAHRQLNQVLTMASDAVMLSALAEVGRTATEVITDNDRNLDSSVSMGITGALSACLFDRAHFREANGSPFAPADPLRPIDPTATRESSKQSRAKRTMGGIANATRFACDTASQHCPQGFVTSRKLGDMLPLPSALGPVRGLIDALVPKWGQTRLLTYQLARGFDHPDGGNLIRHWRDPPNAPQGMMAQGDNLGSDDLYSIKLGPSHFGGVFRNPFACSEEANYWECWGDPRKNKGRDRTLPFRYMMKTSVWALNRSEPRGGGGGVHWRVSYPGWPRGRGHTDPRGSEARLGVHHSRLCAIPAGCVAGIGAVDVFVANVRPIQDGNHVWEGIVPFMHFEPGQYANACPGSHSPSAAEAATRIEEFNQPSTWVVLRKRPDQIRNPLADPAGAGSNAPALLNPEGRVQLGSTREASLEMEASPATLFGSAGLHVIARGQAYYHRPGNWAEQPNFFNPYWRPRLASVYQGRRSLPLIAPLLEAFPDPLKNSPQKFLVH